MHRRCITLISSLLTLSGLVRKPLDFLKVRTGMYWYIPVCTNWEFLYWHVPCCTGTYWYIPVRTILPNPVQGYRTRIPDAGPGRGGGGRHSIGWLSRNFELEFDESEPVIFGRRGGPAGPPLTASAGRRYILDDRRIRTWTWNSRCDEWWVTMTQWRRRPPSRIYLNEN